jgi:glyoxylase-like metal-dependent hydrolase (beta-lactamase superfamily II)
VASKIRNYCTGYCTQRENRYKKGGSHEIQRFRGNAVAIETPNGVVLFDTGYSVHYTEAVKHFPYSLYNRLVPVYFDAEESLRAQLMRNGVSTRDVSYVLISHFHPDHCAGLKDFPWSKVISTRRAYRYLRNRSGIGAVRIGFIPQLLPDDLEGRLQFCEDKAVTALPDSMLPFGEGYDLFGDGSVIGISLEGHARGQFGVLVEDTFLVADAVFSEDFYTQYREQSMLANLVTDDVRQLTVNQAKLRELYQRNTGIRIIHSHS